MDDASSIPCVFLEPADDKVVGNFSSYDIVTLTHEQTATIFHPFLSNPQLEDGRVRMAEKNLAHFNAGIARHFVSKKSLLPQLKLRLLSLRNGLGSTGSGLAYCALSYCCLTSPVKCFAQDTAGESTVRLPLSNMLSAAIVEDARNSCPAIWCDQICIDQSNMAERAVTLSFTDAIYNSAHTVAVVLEDVQLDSNDEAFLQWYAPSYQTTRSKNSFVGPDSRQSPPFAKRHPHLTVLFRKITAARWFRRAWCSHEMRVSSNQMIYIPCSKGGRVARMTASFVYALCQLARELPLPPRTVKLHPEDVASNTIFRGAQGGTQTSPLENFRLLGYLESGGNPDLEAQLREQTATLDKFIIALNSSICGITISPEAFEKASLEIMEPGSWYRWLTALALALRDPLALCASVRPPHVGVTSTPVPWWLCPDHGDCSTDANKLMCPNDYVQSFTFEMEDFDSFIRLPICIAPTWHHRQTSFRHQMLAVRVFIAAGDAAFPSGTDEEALDMPSFLSWKKFLYGDRLLVAMQVLGCILECGVQWLFRLLLVKDVYVSFVPAMNYTEIMEVWKVFGNSWPSCLSMDNYHLEENIQNSPTVKFALQTWMSTKENLKAIHFLLILVSWMCSKSLPLLGAENTEIRSYRPYIWTFGDDQQQQTQKFVILKHDKHRDCEVLPVVPRVLLEDKFHDIRRCWMVCRINQEQMPPKYRLCERQIMYGPSVRDIFNICAPVAVFGSNS